MTTVLMFVFSQCSPFIFSSKFSLKMSLKLSQKMLHLLHAKFLVFLNGPNSFSGIRVLE